MGKNVKTATIRLDDVKDPDGWQELMHKLGVSDEKRRRFLEHGEYASFEMVVDENMNIVGGRIFRIG